MAEESHNTVQKGLHQISVLNVSINKTSLFQNNHLHPGFLTKGEQRRLDGASFFTEIVIK